MTVITKLNMPRHIDRSGWGRGPWDDEPDRVEFEHAGLPCLLTRSRVGVWCGYAAVPPDHPWHGTHYGEVPVDVHGGLTYADACRGSIYHVPQPGEPDNVWWFGFDCGHLYDVMPSRPELEARYPGDAVYRGMAYVRAETTRLAEQIAAKTPHTGGEAERP